MKEARRADWRFLTSQEMHVREFCTVHCMYSVSCILVTRGLAVGNQSFLRVAVTAIQGNITMAVGRINIEYEVASDEHLVRTVKMQ